MSVRKQRSRGILPGTAKTLTVILAVLGGKAAVLEARGVCKETANKRQHISSRGSHERAGGSACGGRPMADGTEGRFDWVHSKSGSSGLIAFAT